MKIIPDFEISLHQRSDKTFTIEGRFMPAGEAAEMRIGSKEPVEMRLDWLELQDCLPEMDRYGQVLTQALFVPEVKNLFLYALASAGSQPLRFRLLIGPTAPALHSLHWETLRHPVDGTLIAANQNILFSRYLSSDSWRPVRLRERRQVRALLAVAGPTDLGDYKLTPIDAAQEIERARQALTGLETACLPDGEARCTLSALTDKLRQGYDLLYLVAHGSLVNGSPYLWLEDETGKVKRISGQELAEKFSGLSAPPSLVVLTSCESAGKAGEDQHDSQTLLALGPLLAEAGVPAVIAMQGKISMSSAARMMPVFLEELQKDGLADRALAAARSVLLAEKAPDAWMPVLFSRLKTGGIWRDEAEEQRAEKIDETTRKSFRLQWFWFPLIFLAVIGMGVGLYFGLRPKQKEVMTGEFRIAIASFLEQGSGLPDKAGYTIGDGIQIRLSDDLREITVGPKVEIWGPDRIGVISGKTPEERTMNAARLAKEIQAFMVIYGVVETDGNEMRVVPEFYLDTQGFSEGSEIIGQYELGSSFLVPGANNPAWTYEFNKAMAARSDVISSLATGLSYYAINDFKSALETFQRIEKLGQWGDNDGKKVLYALLGFSAGKLGDFDLTEKMLKQSLAIDPEYARPYIGLANVAYMRALVPFQKSLKPADIDFALVEVCDAYLEKARQAKNKPPLAEVEAKIHFSQGQCSWLRTYSGHSDSYEPAVLEFQAVLSAYADGQNPRVQELAGEAYARLAVIDRLTGDAASARINYQKAAETLKTISPERASLYQKRADEASAVTPAP
jgi:tetratricopeptide (TPR) repeat protein